MTKQDKPAEVPAGLKLLRVPFAKHLIGQLRKGGALLDFVGHAALTDRLLDADPFWTWEPLAYREGLPAFDANGGLWIKLTVCGLTRLGYGNAKASDHQEIGSREKECIGDALRNAAMRFGAALDLWHKGKLREEDDDTPRPGNPLTKSAATIGVSWNDDDNTPKRGNPFTPRPPIIDVERSIVLEDLATQMVNLNESGYANEAYELYINIKDNDEKLCLWDLLKPHSKVRSAIKRVGEQRRLAEESGNPTPGDASNVDAAGTYKGFE